MKTQYQPSCEKCVMRPYHEQMAQKSDDLVARQTGGADIDQTDDVFTNMVRLGDDYEAPSLTEMIKAQTEGREVEAPVITYVVQESEITCAGILNGMCPAELTLAKLQRV